MSASFPCPSCGAEYTVDQVAPGATFTCGACEAEVTAPAAEALAQVAAAAAPAVTTKPGAMGRSPGPRRSSPRSKTGRKAAPGGRPHGSTAPKAPRSNTGLIVGIGLVVVAAIITVVVATAGNGDKDAGTKDKAGAPEKREDPTELVDGAVARVKVRYDVETAQGAWDAGGNLLAEAEKWSADKKSMSTISMLRAAGKRFQDDAVKLDPDFGPYRETRGQRKYADELLPYTTARWLQDTDRIEAKNAHDKISRMAKRDHGWADAAAFKNVDAMIARLEPLKAQREEMEDSPFFAAAKKLEGDVLADLDRRMKDVKDGKWAGATMKIVKPYVFFVQNDGSWDPAQVASSRSRTLSALQDIIINEFKDLGLKEVDRPVPVLLFRNHKMYQEYAGEGGKGALAHFEPYSGRMAVHDDCNHTTIMHEGTHQLMWFWTERDDATSANSGLRSFWFQEGVAEWYSGAAKLPKPGGGYIYEAGRLNTDRLGGFSRLDKATKKAFNLWDLLPTRYMDRPKIGKEGKTGMVYLQGWFLLYFLHHFNVDEEGYVRPGKRGKYADLVREYMKHEIAGRTGRDLFMKTLKLDDAGLRKMREEYWRYAAYVLRKTNLKQVKERQLIPWDEYTNKRGEKTGEREDDKLPDMPDSAPPAW